MASNDMAAAPPLPPGCVDFNKLHNAAKRGDTHEKALDAALIVPEGEAAPPLPVTATTDEGDKDHG